MSFKQVAHKPTAVLDDYTGTWLEGFITDRRARGMSSGTIAFYIDKLRLFVKFADGQAIKAVPQITAAVVRDYMLWLEERGHNAGGRHCAFRALRTFVYWWADETEPEGWSNPFKKVSPPRIAQEPLPGVDLRTVAGMVGVCERGTFAGDRDRAIILCLLDSGARAREFTALNLENVNQATGEVFISKGKMGKSRYTYLGRTARRALRKYLKHRQDNINALWVTLYDTERLDYQGLRFVVKRRAKQAGVPCPGIHDFRRACALQLLRSGADVYSISRILGHADITMLRRYLALADADAQAAHAQHSPVDGLERG